MTWTDGKRGKKIEIVAILSDRAAEKARLDEYALRMRIEESFRDDQSGGFELEQSRLKDPARLERLLLSVAIATLWCHEIGEQVIKDQALQDESIRGQRARIEYLPTRIALYQAVYCCCSSPFTRSETAFIKPCSQTGAPQSAFSSKMSVNQT